MLISKMNKIALVILFGSLVPSSTPADPKEMFRMQDPLVQEARNFNVSMPPLFEVYRGSNHSGYRVTGLSTMKRKHNFGFGSLSFEFHLELDHINIIGKDYNAAGFVNATPLRTETFPSGEFEGSWKKCSFSMKKFFLDGNADAALKGGNRVRIDRLEIDNLRFASMVADLGPEFYVNGTAMNWEAWNKVVKENFDQDFEERKEGIVEKLRLTINHFIEKYTLTELLAAGEEGDVVKNVLSILPQSSDSNQSKKKKGGKKSSQMNLLSSLV